MASIGNQFSKGDLSNKESFWRSGFQQCQNPSCAASSGKSTISSQDYVAGCRMNGDAYGTTVFSCQDCDWKTSFQYDEASDVYYYETRFYKSNSAPKKPPHLWAGINMSNWLVECHLDSSIPTKLGAFTLDGPTISEMGEPQLKALGLTTKEAKKVVAAIQNKTAELQSSKKKDT